MVFGLSMLKKAEPFLALLFHFCILISYGELSMLTASGVVFEVQF